MANNTRALTKDELNFLNDKYTFELVGNYIIVSCKGFNRKVLHNIDSAFSLNTSLRKIKITKEAIDLWINEFKDNYTLLDVQSALNSLIVTYQDISANEILNVLERGTTTIKTI